MNRKPTMLIETWEDYLIQAKKLAQNSPYIYISTFGIRDKELESFNKAGTKILIGTYFGECSKDCEHCKNLNQNKLKFVKDISGKYKAINFKLVKELHLKCFVTNQGVIIGSMNYTGSGWTDLSYLITDVPIIRKLKQKFEDLWTSKEKVSSSKVDKKAHIINSNILNFGKYKGKTISWLQKNDSSYLNWCKKEGLF